MSLKTTPTFTALESYNANQQSLRSYSFGSSKPDSPRPVKGAPDPVAREVYKAINYRVFYIQNSALCMDNFKVCFSIYYNIHRRRKGGVWVGWDMTPPLFQVFLLRSPLPLLYKTIGSAPLL